MCLVLHPCHKLNYFKNAKWEDDWIEDARQLVRDEFDLSYNCGSTSQESSNQVCITTSCIHFLISLCSSLYSACHCSLIKKR